LFKFDQISFKFVVDTDLNFPNFPKFAQFGGHRIFLDFESQNLGNHGSRRLLTGTSTFRLARSTPVDCRCGAVIFTSEFLLPLLGVLAACLHDLRHEKAVQ
jgi:hypothetical protein